MADPTLAQAVAKLLPLAKAEKLKVEAHHALALEIAREVSQDAVTCVLPNIGPDASTVSGLVHLADAVISANSLVAAKTTEDV